MIIRSKDGRCIMEFKYLKSMEVIELALSGRCFIRAKLDGLSAEEDVFIGEYDSVENAQKDLDYIIDKYLDDANFVRL